MKNISCHLPGRSIKALFLSHLVEKKGFETSIRGILTGQFRASFSGSGYAWKRSGNSPGDGTAKRLLSQAASFPTVSASSPAQLCATFTRVSIHPCAGLLWLLHQTGTFWQIRVLPYIHGLRTWRCLFGFSVVYLYLKYRNIIII